jgi:ABC-type transport system involved in multi-copper enzyme maturation permease subunit
LDPPVFVEGIIYLEISMALFAFVPDWTSNWLTPLWLLGVGCLVGLAILCLVWGVLWVVTRGLAPHQFFRRTADEVPLAVGEGALLPVFAIVAAFAAFGIIGTMFAQRPADLLLSLRGLGSVGTRSVEVTVPPTPRDEDNEADMTKEVPILVGFMGNEIREIVVESSQDLTLSAVPAQDQVVDRPEFRVAGGTSYRWMRGEQTAISFGDDYVEEMFVVNHGTSDATVRMDLRTTLAFPEVFAIPVTALSVIAVFLMYFLQRTLFPRMSAIALATFKSDIAQPLFAIILAVGISALVIFVFLPYNTFGEDIKMLKDSGFSLIMFLCLLQTVWSASTSVSEEIEGRTALTVLSKPVRRTSFVLGKFFGISWTLLLMYLILGTVFLILVAYKPIYDAKETSASDPTWQLCYYELAVTIPGLVLSFMQTLVLAAVSVAISTRLPLLANIMICFSVFVLGNITPLLVQSSEQQFEIVGFFAQLIATVLPNLEVFNMQAAIAADAEVPLAYLALALVYCGLYSIIAMLLALLLFEDRDLA